jgi:predicted DNA-binding transcriptional regulator YafY
MDRTERLYVIERLVRQRGHASFSALQEALEVSRATLWRDIEYLRSRLGAPLEYDRFVNGYRFAPGTGADRATSHELPGLWFSERELYSLLMAHQLLSGLEVEGAGLSRHLQPLLDRIHALLAHSGASGAGNGPGETPAAHTAQALMQRVRIIVSARRDVPARCFEQVGEALMRRRRLHLRYLTRGRGTVSERDVSPQRLVHHRNTWYLDAWCHRALALRRFALDAVETAQVLDDAAREMPLATVQSAMDAGYGIYAGAKPRWAVLRFAPLAAQWVSRERWHPEQQGRWLADGQWELRLPYTGETELVMDVLRHGDEVEVIRPAALREAVVQRLGRALQRYQGSGSSDGGVP